MRTADPKTTTVLPQRASLVVGSLVWEFPLKKFYDDANKSLAPENVTVGPHEDPAEPVLRSMPLPPAPPATNGDYFGERGVVGGCV